MAFIEAGVPTLRTLIAYTPASALKAIEVLGYPVVLKPNTGSWGRDRVYMRALTIAGGTTQVNKNIIAQRVLGLPRG